MQKEYWSVGGGTQQGSGNMRFQRCQGGSYNTPTYIPAYTIKNNKLHEGVQWSQHTKDFYYIQAWDEFLSYEFFTR